MLLELAQSGRGRSDERPRGHKTPGPSDQPLTRRCLGHREGGHGSANESLCRTGNGGDVGVEVNRARRETDGARGRELAGPPPFEGQAAEGARAEGGPLGCAGSRSRSTALARLDTRRSVRRADALGLSTLTARLQRPPTAALARSDALQDGEIAGNGYRWRFFVASQGPGRSVARQIPSADRGAVRPARKASSRRNPVQRAKRAFSGKADGAAGGDPQIGGPRARAGPASQWRGRLSRRRSPPSSWRRAYPSTAGHTCSRSLFFVPAYSCRS